MKIPQINSSYRQLQNLSCQKRKKKKILIYFKCAKLMTIAVGLDIAISNKKNLKICAKYNAILKSNDVRNIYPMSTYTTCPLLLLLILNYCSFCSVSGIVIMSLAGVLSCCRCTRCSSTFWATLQLHLLAASCQKFSCCSKLFSGTFWPLVRSAQTLQFSFKDACMTRPRELGGDS